MLFDPRLASETSGYHFCLKVISGSRHVFNRSDRSRNAVFNALLDFVDAHKPLDPPTTMARSNSVRFLALSADFALVESAPTMEEGETKTETTSNEFFGEPFRDFEYIDGVHLAASVLWCDAQRKNGLNFLSSALAGDIARNRRMLCTEETLRLASRGKGKVDVLTAPYDQILTVGDLELSLHPSGHLLGSAQLRAKRSGRVVVYTGEVSTRSSATALAAEPVRCDVIALPATYARRPYRFPERERVLDDILQFIEVTLTERQTPVLLAQPLGIGQELITVLGRKGYRLRVHRSMAEIAKLYGSLGVSLPSYKRFTKTVGRGEVVLFPTILRTSVESLIPDGRVALVDPRAVDAAYVHQLRLRDAFALTNLPDRDELIAFVEATEAGEVFLTGGAVSEFGEELRAKGLKVYDLQPQRQLELFPSS